MALIKWNSSLSIGINEIDGQHKKLVDLINHLHEGMQKGQGKDVLKGILQGLIEYTQVHFKTEEVYFEQFGYEDTSIHKKEHADFVAKVSDFKKGFDDDQFGLSIEIMDFLSAWLRGHIKGSDQKYADCFKQNGVE